MLIWVNQMNKEKKFVFNTFIISIGKICTQLVSFFLLPLYTSVLSTTEYGIVDLVNTLVGLFLPILMLQIDQGVFRELIEVRENKLEKSKIISSSFYFIIFMNVLALMLFCILFNFINNDYKWYFLLNIIVISFPTLFLQISRGIDKNLDYSVGSFIIAFSTIILNIVLILVFKFRVEGMLIASILGQVIGGIYLFVKLKIFSFLDLSYFSFDIIKKLIKYSLPLIPNAISWWIFNASDRIIVSLLMGVSFTGILSAANKFSALYISAFSIFQLSFTESVSICIKDDDGVDFFNNTFSNLVKMFSSLALVIISFVPFAYTLLLHSKFISGYVLVPILMIAAVFNVIVGLLGSVYIANRNTKEIARTSILSAIINVVVNLVLIKFIGLYAAALSTLISYLIICIYRFFDVNNKYIRLKFKMSTIIYFIVSFLLISISYYINNVILNFITLIFTIIFVFIINYDIVKKILYMLYKKVKNET